MKLNTKDIKKFLYDNLITVFIGFFIVTMIIITTLIVNMSKITVSIKVDDDKAVSVHRIGELTTVDALNKAGIILDDGDYVSKNIDDSLKDGDLIIVKKAQKVIVTNGEKSVYVHTGLKEKTDIIKQASFNLDKDQHIDNINYKNTSVYGVLNPNQKLVSKVKNLKYKTVYKETKTLKGEDQKVVQKGKTGKQSYVSIVTTNKGKKSSRIVTTSVISKPQNKVVKIAKDARNTIMSASGTPLKFSSKRTVEVTAYCGCSKCCGKSTGRTASGTYATAGRTIAAGSNLSFGTKVYFPGMTGGGNDGVYTVEDRGGAISSSRIDIFFSSHSQALAFGRRTMTVYILK